MYKLCQENLTHVAHFQTTFKKTYNPVIEVKDFFDIFSRFPNTIVVSLHGEYPSFSTGRGLD